MSWIATQSFKKKPIVVIEDHVYHIQEILDSLKAAGGNWLEQLTVVCLDRQGPDTDRAVKSWLDDYPELQVVAQINDVALLSPPARERFQNLERRAFEDRIAFCKLIAALMRPRGLLLQDIQLDTLSFLSPSRWWESIYLASTVRGMFPLDPPACRFMSNKSSFSISFGKEMVEAGFDPRDVIDKNELAQIVPVVFDAYLNKTFPLVLEIADGEREPRQELIRQDEAEQIEAELDLVLWLDGDRVVLGGRLIKARSSGRSVLKPKGHEASTWTDLLADGFDLGPGIPVQDVGCRIAPEGSGKAELTNAAARHLHTLRGRLKGDEIIITESHAYHLIRRLRLGRVRAR